MADLTELQKRINSIVAQDYNAPTAGGEDWNLYLQYINMAQNEWQEAYEWPSLFKEVNTNTSQSTGLASISLPADFRKVDGFLKIAGNEYAQIEPVKKSQYNETDKYFYILGSPGSYTMVVNPSNHGSGASISYSYWATANALASPTDVSLCPDPAYLTQRSIAYLWEARDDGRFPQAKSDADRIMARMLEFENTKGNSFSDRVDTVENSKYGFRIGRD